MATWTTLDHTADLAIEARGGNSYETLDALIEGLLAQITDSRTVRATETVEIIGEGGNLEETLVAVLGEILFRINGRGWVFRDVRATSVAPLRIVLAARGEPFDPARHTLEQEVKAATYHDLFFGPAEQGDTWVARVIFDV